MPWIWTVLRFRRTGNTFCPGSGPRLPWPMNGGAAVVPVTAWPHFVKGDENMQKRKELTPQFLEELRAISGDRVIVGSEVNPDYARDEMPIYGTQMPQASIDVLTTEEIAAIVKLCYENDVPVTCRGAGTGLVGGCTPICGGVVLCTMKMNQILGYDEENFLVRVQCGVLLNDLAEDALKRGLLYPPDPGEKFATLGGNAATNAGGMRAVKYGTTRDYVRAMTVVLPNGETVQLGAAVSKSSSGYSLLDLMIGSEGTLGIITELTLKLIPAPKYTASLVCPFGDLADCISTVPKFKKAHMDPQALEFFEKEILISSEQYLGKTVFPRVVEGQEVNAYLLVTFDANSQDALDALVEQGAEQVLEAGALDVLVADSPAKMRDAWAARSSFLEGIEEQTKLLDECDVVVPVSEIARFVLFIKEIEGQFDFAVKMFGHAGDGNLHVYTCSNDMEKEPFCAQVDRFMEQLYQKTVELGGQISGEHGIGMGKVKYLAKTEGEVKMRLMKGIKDAFDPKGLLNPGKITPWAEGR